MKLTVSELRMLEAVLWNYQTLWEECTDKQDTNSIYVTKNIADFSNLLKKIKLEERL